MPDLLLEMYKEQLDWGWITLDDLKANVNSGLLAPDDFEKIAGQTYVA